MATRAIALIASIPGYDGIARDLEHRRIRFDPQLADRGQASLTGVITLGPEAFQGEPDMALVSVSGTLVHEQWHTRQNPFEKTVSFWAGVVTRTHPMRRFERPAYAAQAAFLTALSAARPDLAALADREREAVVRSFHSVYGKEKGRPRRGGL